MGAYLLWRERLTRVQVAGIALIALAVAVLSVLRRRRAALRLLLDELEQPPAEVPERRPDEKLVVRKVERVSSSVARHAHVTGQERMPVALRMEREADRRLDVSRLVERPERTGLEVLDASVERL